MTSMAIKAADLAEASGFCFEANNEESLELLRGGEDASTVVTRVDFEVDFRTKSCDRFELIQGFKLIWVIYQDADAAFAELSSDESKTREGGRWSGKTIE